MLSDALDKIFNEVDGRIPKINPFIGNGVAYSQMQDLHLYIHQLLCTLLKKENEPRLPADFDYMHYELLTPEEEYQERGNKKNKQSNRSSSLDGYQYAPTDTYFVRYLFKNRDSVIKRCVQIPFVRRGGITQISGTKYTISPVIKTRGLSITPKGFFVAFDANPVNFERANRHFTVNGAPCNFWLPITNDLHRFNKKGSKAFRPPLAAWLFAKYGVHETFKKYLNIDINIVNVNDTALSDYDTEEYAVCRAPLPFKREKRSQFAIVLPREELTQHAEILIGTLFYVTSFHGDRMPVEHLDNVTLWCLLLGYSIHGELNYNDAKHIVMIEDHLKSIEQYIDHKFKHELLHEGVICETIYDFLNYVIIETTHISAKDNKHLANLWGRYLTCIEYVVSELRSKIQKAQWDLCNAAKDSFTGERGLPVTKRNVEGIINRSITADTLTRINTGHGEIATVQVTTDNMLIGVTSRAIDESDAKKSSGSGKKVVDLNDPTKHIHASFIEIGSVANLPKSSPFGWAVLNPYLETDENAKLVRKTKNVALLDKVQSDLSQKGTN